jgi:hypothetical protein
VILHIIAQWPPASDRQIISVEAPDLAHALDQVKGYGVVLLPDPAQVGRYRDQEQRLYRVFVGERGVGELVVAMQEAGIITPGGAASRPAPAHATFELGRLLATPGALSALADVGLTPIDLLTRHRSGDWGDLGSDDKRANDYAVKNGERILSAYQIGGHRFYVITEWDRSVTTVLLAEEY